MKSHYYAKDGKWEEFKLTQSLYIQGMKPSLDACQSKAINEQAWDRFEKQMTEHRIPMNKVLTCPNTNKKYGTAIHSALVKQLQDEATRTDE